MKASRPRLPGELFFALAMLLFGVTALWQAWRIAGFSSWSSPGVMPMIAAVSLAAIYVIFETAFSVVLPEGVLRGVFR